MGDRWGAGGAPKLGTGTQAGTVKGVGQSSPPCPSPPACPAYHGPWVESGAGSAGPGSRWRCISSGPAPSPPLPSAEAPAALACSAELKAKPAVESTALAHGGLIPVSGGDAAPTATSRARGAVLGTGLCWWGCRGLHQPVGACSGPWLCRVPPGHVADAHECPCGGFTELLIRVAIGSSDPRCGVRSFTRVTAARAGCRRGRTVPGEAPLPRPVAD